MTAPRLTEDVASRFAGIALANVVREYPNQPSHVLGSAADLRPSRELHPAFFGSYDWHSAVHMHWLLAHLRRRFSALPERAGIDAIFDGHLAPGSIAGECAYFEGPNTRAFERTYGWAWLLKFATELHIAEEESARRWSANLAPLVEVIVARYLEFLPKAHYPIRHGIHANSAFGLSFAIDFARVTARPALEAMCVDKARDWFAADRHAPAEWELSGADFLSPALVEADLMRRVLPAAPFGAWLAHFLPGLERREPATLFTPPTVTDRLDPQMVHFDGLSLSRAWCFRGIGASLPAGDSRRAILGEAALAHLRAGLAGIEHADYAGSHWLASFAALALAD